MSQRPVFSSPVTPGWNGDPRAFLGAPHPAVTSDARPSGDRALSTDPELRSRQHQSVLQSACSLISCDLVSHGRRVLLDGDRRVHRREQGARHQSRAVRRRHGGRCPRWNDANVQAQSLRTTSRKNPKSPVRETPGSSVPSLTCVAGNRGERSSSGQAQGFPLHPGITGEEKTGRCDTRSHELSGLT